MINTKRGTTPVLKVSLDGLTKPIRRVDFVFKQKKTEAAEALVTKVYGSEYGTVVLEDGIFYIPMDDIDSRRFKPAEKYYMDVRVVYEDGSIPATPIIELYSLPTLFREVTIW